MPTEYTILWDLDDEPHGNVQHIAEHGLTKEDFEHALMQAIGFEESDTLDRELAFGPALDGRLIVIIYDVIMENMIRPVTAFDAGEA